VIDAQAAFAIETSRDTLTTVAAMKSATVQLKEETKKINMDELEVAPCWSLACHVRPLLTVRLPHGVLHRTCKTTWRICWRT
jgi:hypothetical protein